LVIHRRAFPAAHTESLTRPSSPADLGGLFKDFWTDFAEIVFSLEFGLFSKTVEGHLYPNPCSVIIHGEHHLRLFEAVGCSLGKAVWEGITISPTFAHSFLGFLKGSYDFSKM
jgi:hypothetical protein